MAHEYSESYSGVSVSILDFPKSYGANGFTEGAVSKVDSYYLVLASYAVTRHVTSQGACVCRHVALTTLAIQTEYFF